ncbi:MAG: hypothetical protein A2655_03745 [Candidatus Yanofskybacteria bacterium RIFCSPHIGHO2_01_FULL_43_42]|uniref:Isoleucine--tRNA ligase n=1 Tax=Candidatus Yanofskybacteria bacterium RIFCSPLOWO2_01_FULL_43_22 TaxID=1802695 RepID=A0A1F8GF57_9BACT|nr:MAG: hypothetical protein A2655_03745 [Candidatus Yanofskybacteria bacterium RIFCSPHIGHO2_01_FULL_43_42]OGN12909.1 MAG: hypothetical protein A3D48_03280 [Candidatus Yanofskybacteria bacterium RIFCSPHIGHO2_02_FULL_43_17]OGN24012.1 MAG: hypothetical protein A3A13_02985 [Candidatus Yanofskybacteria bacterium RIFCSPLOWO2_01_FULL_43_22]
MLDFKRIEQDTLSFWKKNKIFEKSLALRPVRQAHGRQAQGKKHFVFFEGPPTANGLPHIGHFLTRVYKDVYGRYKTMRGFFVLRKAGWDTHGLPVEIEVEKELGFKNKKDIEKYGIAEFNKKAKENVWKYKAEWEEMTRRTGFWLDTDNPYVTYENKYIESLWAIIKKIWDKKLLYLAHRVVPFCTRCGTPLSSHEVAQGYKKVSDRSVFVKFKVKSLKLKSSELKNLGTDNLQTYILAWTTTPWTLPGNVALAVGKDIDYAVVRVGEENYILAEAAVERIFKSDSKFEILNSKFKGSDLVGLEYESLFDVKELKSEKSYKIYDADFVSTADGTGVVHTAVMYGEDDYNLGTKIGLPKFHTVDEQGRFTGVSKELDGKYVKDPATEELILQKLVASGYLLVASPHEHDYPFCWRCDTPLIYYAKESWFIKMSALKDKLLKNNGKINWIPEHIKEGRFGQWLKEGKDWAFSRERYWGTPLPIWKCGDCGEFLAVGSMDDLETYRYKPKNEFYILRHGHSEKNGQGGREIISSLVEADKYHLTEDGKEQIKKAAQKLKKTGEINLIISSPFIRTQETAEIVAKELGQEVITEPLLGEFQHGSLCEGREHSLCAANHLVNQGWETKTVDGESWKDVRRRMSGFLRKLDEKYSGQRILIVSHGDPLWLLETFTLGLNPEETISSRDSRFIQQGELKKIDLKNWPYDDDGELDLHRPYIDRIELKCKKCGGSFDKTQSRPEQGRTGGKMTKVPDLIDVWFDSGAMPYAQWHWPFKETRDKQQETSNLKMFKEQFPADFIVEAIDQTRGWFYTLLAVSTLLDKGTPYKNVMVLGHTLDEKGRKMSKSLKNFVPVMDLMDKYGVDVLRWYFLSSMPMGESKSVIPKEIEDKFKGFMTTLDNCVRFYELYASDKATWTHDTRPKELLDKWILSKLHGLVSEVTESLDNYDPTTAARAIEKFVVEDFSNWWLRRSRKRKEALDLLRFILLHLAKVLAPFTPFMAEDIKTRMHKFQKAGHESVHLNDWPEVDKKLIDKKLEEEMDKVREVVRVGLALRKEKQIKVRQPLAKIILGGSQDTKATALLRYCATALGDLIKEELNVKEVVFNENQKEDTVLDVELTQPLIFEGYARELMRQIQDMRKEAKYRLDDRVFAQWHSDDEGLSEAIRQFSDEIKKEVLLSEFNNGPHDGKAYDVEKEFELVPQRKIWIGLKK